MLTYIMLAASLFHAAIAISAAEQTAYFLVTHPEVTHEGCWKDSFDDRAMRNFEALCARDFGWSAYKGRDNAVKQCHDCAKSMELPYFSVQDGGACFGVMSASPNIKMYGQSTRCGSGTGGPLAFDLYKMAPYDHSQKSDKTWIGGIRRGVVDSEPKTDGIVRRSLTLTALGVGAVGAAVAAAVACSRKQGYTGVGTTEASGHGGVTVI